MDRLYFGVRARRRARLKRGIAWLAFLSLGAMIVGIPGSYLGVTILRVVIERIEPGGSVEHVTVNHVSALPSKEVLLGARPTPASPRQTTRLDERRNGWTSVGELVAEAGREFGVDSGYLLRIAECESGGDPNAYNPAGYHGLFQYDAATWAAYGYGDIYDPVAQARTTARLLANGHGSRWPNCA